MPGAPPEKVTVEWDGSRAQVRWAAPQGHLNGVLQGYRLAYCSAHAPEVWPTPLHPHCSTLQPTAPYCTHCSPLQPAAPRCSRHCHPIAPQVSSPRQVVVDVGLVQEKTLELAPAMQNLSLHVSPYMGAGDGPWSPPVLLLAHE